MRPKYLGREIGPPVPRFAWLVSHGTQFAYSRPMRLELCNTKGVFSCRRTCSPLYLCARYLLPLCLLAALSACAAPDTSLETQAAVSYGDWDLEAIDDLESTVPQSVVLLAPRESFDCKPGLNSGWCKYLGGGPILQRSLERQASYRELADLGFESRLCTEEEGSSFEPPVSPLWHQPSLVRPGQASGVIVDGSEFGKLVEDREKLIETGRDTLLDSMVMDLGRPNKSQRDAFLRDIEGEALLLTSGHAITPLGGCDNLAAVRHATGQNGDQFEAQDYARCKRVYWTFDPNNIGHYDSAIVVLDRPEWKRFGVKLPIGEPTNHRHPLQVFGHVGGRAQSMSQGNTVANERSRPATDEEKSGAKKATEAPFRDRLGSLYASGEGQSGGPIVDLDGVLHAIVSTSPGIIAGNRFCFQTQDAMGHMNGPCRVPSISWESGEAIQGELACRDSTQPGEYCLESLFVDASETALRRGCWRPVNISLRVIESAQNNPLLLDPAKGNFKFFNWLNRDVTIEEFLRLSVTTFPTQVPPDTNPPITPQCGRTHR